MEAQETRRLLGRRGLLAGGLAAAYALVGRTSAARAQGTPLELGVVNRSDATTEVDATRQGIAALVGKTREGDVGAIGAGADLLPGLGLRAGVVGHTEESIGVLARVGDSPIVAWETSAAVWAAGGKAPGLVGTSDSHIGAIGISGAEQVVDPTEFDPAGAHFVGFGAAAGACVNAEGTAPGVIGMAKSNIGVIGATGTAAADDDELYELMPSGVHGAGGDDVGVCGRSTTIGVLGEGGAKGAGVWGAAGTAEEPTLGAIPVPTGVWGQGSGEAVGVLGQANTIALWGAAGDPTATQLPVVTFPTGVWGQSVRGGVGVLGASPLIGVWGAAQAEADVDLPAVQTPSGLWGQTDLSDGVGVLARHEKGGKALAVQGSAAFSGIGQAEVPPSQGSVFVAAGDVNGDSLVIVTLTGDPGNATTWVELQPGRGFIVHVTMKAKKALPFTYLVFAREAA